MTGLTTSVPLVAPRTAATLRERCRGGFALLRFWRERSRQRDALAELDDRLLSDIGITREQARRECAKPFWR